MLVRTITTLGAVAAAAALLMAIALIGLVTDPIAVADAVGTRGDQAFVGALAELIVRSLGQVIRWL